MLTRPSSAASPVIHLIYLGMIVLSGCSSPEDAASSAPAGGVLVLVNESKLSKLLPDQGSDWEASGVIARDGFLHIVFDNSTSIGTVNVSLSQGTLTAGELKSSQYEGITHDDHGTPHYYVVKETDGDSVFRGEIIQLDEAHGYQGSEETDVIFQDKNTGLEGIAWLWADDADHMLALCEANGCGAGDMSPGHGRLKVLVQEEGVWLTEAQLELPAAAGFLDYSDIALRDRGDGTATVAVVSQRSSALWLGTLAQGPWRLVGSGAVYSVPAASDGSVRYCDVEGVTFLDDRTFAMVSDKSSGSGACKDKDESVHVFELP